MEKNHHTQSFPFPSSPFPFSRTASFPFTPRSPAQNPKMKGRRISLIFIIIGIAVRVGFYLYHRLSVLGSFRNPTRKASSFAVDDQIFLLDGLSHCEDLTYIPELGKIYTACQGDMGVRYGWFPPLSNFDRPSGVEGVDGGLYSIDVEVGSTETSP